MILTATAPAAAARITPRSVIRSSMHRTVEVGSGRHFQPVGARHTMPDGHGGVITAQVAMPDPTADGYGNLVFFFHGTHFVGWDFKYEALSIQRFDVRDGAIRVRYANYSGSDPLCCPSQHPVTVRFRWAHGRLRSSGTSPRPRGPRVRFG